MNCNQQLAADKREVHNDVADMMAWEDGTLDNWSEIKLFQRLINSGLAWKLQGCYGRHAHALLQEGICHAATPNEVI